jgi:hypothetical protein
VRSANSADTTPLRLQIPPFNPFRQVTEKIETRIFRHLTEYFCSRLVVLPGENVGFCQAELVWLERHGTVVIEELVA